jgi:hypothetical protein
MHVKSTSDGLRQGPLAAIVIRSYPATRILDVSLIMQGGRKQMTRKSSILFYALDPLKVQRPNYFARSTTPLACVNLAHAEISQFSFAETASRRTISALLTPPHYTNSTPLRQGSNPFFTKPSRPTIARPIAFPAHSALFSQQIAPLPQGHVAPVTNWPRSPDGVMWVTISSRQ